MLSRDAATEGAMTCDERREDNVDVVVGCIVVAARGRNLGEEREPGFSPDAIYTKLLSKMQDDQGF